MVLCDIELTISPWGALKDWNEALVAHFLRRPAKSILFNVTQDVISSIHESEGFLNQVMMQ